MKNARNPYLRTSEEEVYVPAPGPPQVPIPSPEICKAMGQENIFKMCEDFLQSSGNDRNPACVSRGHAKIIGKTGRLFCVPAGRAAALPAKTWPSKAARTAFPIQNYRERSTNMAGCLSQNSGERRQKICLPNAAHARLLELSRRILRVDGEHSMTTWSPRDRRRKVLE